MHANTHRDTNGLGLPCYPPFLQRASGESSLQSTAKEGGGEKCGDERHTHTRTNAPLQDEGGSRKRQCACRSVGKRKTRKKMQRESTGLMKENRNKKREGAAGLRRNRKRQQQRAHSKKRKKNKTQVSVETT
jgi:hypothetical protein